MTKSISKPAAKPARKGKSSASRKQLQQFVYLGPVTAVHLNTAQFHLTPGQVLTLHPQDLCNFKRLFDRGHFQKSTPTPP